MHDVAFFFFVYGWQEKYADKSETLKGWGKIAKQEDKRNSKACLRSFRNYLAKKGL